LQIIKELRRNPDHFGLEESGAFLCAAAQFPQDFDIAGLHEKYEKARYGESG